MKKKILLLPERLHAAIAFTGVGNFYSFDPYNLNNSRFCSDKSVARLDLNLYEMTSDYFSTHMNDNDIFSRESIQLYTDLCIEKFKALPNDAMLYFHSKPILTALLLYYRHDQTYAYSIGVGMDENNNKYGN
jgi:hypothetical protein